jgi:DNA-binding protein HU-beta
MRHRDPEDTIYSIWSKLMATKKSNRCWPSYEPVPGKEEHEQGSCRPKAESKLSADEKKFRASRKKQLDNWKRKHPGKSAKAAQHLSAPEARKKRPAKKAAASRKRTGAKRSAQRAA